MYTTRRFHMTVFTLFQNKQTRVNIILYFVTFYIILYFSNNDQRSKNEKSSLTFYP